MSQYVKDDRFPYLYLNQVTQVWYVRKKKRGKKPLFKSTGEKQKGRANTKALLLIAEWLGSKRGPGFVCPLFREFAEEYLIHLEKDTKLRVRTKANARMYIKELIQEIGHMPLDEINEGFFEEWLTDFRARKNRATFADYYAYLGKVLKHAHAKELINRLPRFRNPDQKKETGRVFTRAEVRAMISQLESNLAEAERTSDKSKKMRSLTRATNALLQFRMSLNCFMRKREALLLSWDRVDLDKGVITLRPEDVKTGSRTGKGRSFYVDQKHVLPLLKRVHESQDAGTRWVFPSPTDPSKPTWDNKTAWANLKEDAEIENRGRWHDLRHTAITWALVGDDEFRAELEKMTPEDQEKARRNRLMNPLLVSAYAGVDLRTITRVYLKVKPEHTRDVAGSIGI